MRAVWRRPLRHVIILPRQIPITLALTFEFKFAVLLNQAHTWYGRGAMGRIHSGEGCNHMRALVEYSP